MNYSSIFGVIAAVTVFAISIFSASPTWEIFFDVHGILVVVGGTAAAAILCFPFKTLLSLVKVLFRKFLGRTARRSELVIQEIVDLASAQKDDPEALRLRVDTIRTPFLKEAIRLHVDGGVSGPQLDAILKKRASFIYKKHQKEAGVFKTVAKFPPAFGLMGTTIGMIALLQSLGTADAYKRLGPAMAIGLVATLYGIALANFVFIPVGENLSKLNEEDHILREIVMDGLQLLRAQEHPLVVEEYLKSYLSPADRNRLKKVA